MFLHEALGTADAGEKGCHDVRLRASAIDGNIPSKDGVLIDLEKGTRSKVVHADSEWQNEFIMQSAWWMRIDVAWIIL